MDISIECMSLPQRQVIYEWYIMLVVAKLTPVCTVISPCEDTFTWHKGRLVFFLMLLLNNCNGSTGCMSVTHNDAAHIIQQSNTVWLSKIFCTGKPRLTFCLEICIISTYAIKSLWPNDAIWRQTSRSTLVQVMAYCLTAPSHYLNQCWLIISEVKWLSYEGNFISYASAINYLN